jgi:hypothetical protein
LVQAPNSSLDIGTGVHHVNVEHRLPGVRVPGYGNPDEHVDRNADRQPSHEYTDRNVNGNSDGHEHTDCNADTHSHPNAAWADQHTDHDEDVNCYRHINCYSDVNCYRDAAWTDQHPDGDINGNLDADGHGNSLGDQHTDRDANGKRNGYAHGDANRIAHTGGNVDCDCDAYGDGNANRDGHGDDHADAHTNADSNGNANPPSASVAIDQAFSFNLEPVRAVFSAALTKLLIRSATFGRANWAVQSSYVLKSRYS